MKRGKRVFRKIVGYLLSVTMLSGLFVMLPMCQLKVKATENNRIIIGNCELSLSDASWSPKYALVSSDTATSVGADEDHYNVKFYCNEEHNQFTLVLRNANYTGSYIKVDNGASGLYINCPDLDLDSYIDVQLEGINVFQGTYTGGDVEAYGIYSKNDLKFSGSGSLTAGDENHNIGIWTRSSRMLVESGTIIGIAGKTKNAGDHGISAGDGLIMSGGSVTGKGARGVFVKVAPLILNGGTLVGDSSDCTFIDAGDMAAGVYAVEGININAGTLKGFAAKFGDHSNEYPMTIAGIYAGEEITATGGTIIGYGNPNEGINHLQDNSMGIMASQGISISDDATMTARGGVISQGTSTGLYFMGTGELPTSTLKN